jgi:hypothetical protein
MGLKDWVSDFVWKNGEEDVRANKKPTKRKAVSKTKKKTILSKGTKETDKEYANRFQKFYHLNKKRLNKERRSGYKTKAKKGNCVRCKRKAKKDIVFCDYHQQKQKEYNAKARKKRKK